MHSLTRICGALERRADGWYWVNSGQRAAEIHDLPLRALLPAFDVRFQHGHHRVQIPDGWEAIFPVEADVARIINWTARVLGERALMFANFSDPFTSVKRVRPPGYTVTLPRWQTLGDSLLPAWSDTDAATILQRAYDEGRMAHASDLAADAKRIVDHFYFGNRWQHPERAAARWSTVESLLRERYGDDRAGFLRAENRCFRWVPDNLEDMSDFELVEFTEAFGFV